MKNFCFVLLIILISACQVTPKTNVTATETAIAGKVIAQLTADAPPRTPPAARAVPSDMPTVNASATPIPQPTVARQAATPIPTKPNVSTTQPIPTSQPTAIRQLATPVPTKPIVPTTQPVPTSQPVPKPSGYRFVASSLAKKYYYCETDPAWRSLSQKNLVWFNSEEEAKRSTGMVLHAPCR
jgi:hypothetical protein